MLSTFVWVARVNARGVPSPPNSSFPGRQRAAGVHGVGRRSCDPEPRAGRAASRTHPSSPAGALTEGSEETRHTRPASWPLASWERRREEGKGLEKTSFSGTWGTCQKTGGQSLLRKRKVKANWPETPNGGLRPHLGPGHDLCPSEDLCDRSAGLRCQGRWPVTSRFLATIEQSPVCS